MIITHLGMFWKANELSESTIKNIGLLVNG